MDLDRLENDILPRVVKPTRYTGGEWNSVRKDWSEVELTFALVFPDTYEIGMSNLGMQILYDILNRRPEIACERAFSPWTDMEEQLRAYGIPLFSLESRRPLRDFRAIGFSLGYELTYTNALNVLDLAGIPVLSSERGDSDPIIVAGGTCCFNPEPVSDFVDAFVIGEGEEVVLELAEALKPRDSRAETLLRLAAVPGIYVPSFYDVAYGTDGTIAGVKPNRPGIPEMIVRRTVSDLDSAAFPESPIIPFCETVHDRISLEILRGCTRGCRFCQAGMLCRPVRERSVERLEHLAEVQVKSTGHEEIGLLSLSSADHSKIRELVSGLLERWGGCGIGISLPSLRTDTFSVELAAQVQRVRKSGLTLAPEAGTQRLRNVINKNVTEEDLLASVEAAFAAGWRTIKLYFMIGLPTETDEDVLGIAQTAMKVGGIARKKRVPARINVSVSSFVPKPNTPFQWRAQDSLEELDRKQRMLRDALRDRWINLSWHEPVTSRLEAVMARGDRRVGKAIHRAWQLGCRLDGWQEHFKSELWARAFEETGLDPAFYANRERPHEERLPWEHISCGVTRDFLIVEDEAAQEANTTGDCRWDRCSACGACAGKP